MINSSVTRPCPQCGTQCAEQHKYCPVCGFPVGTVGANQTADKLIGRELPGGYLIIDLLSVGGMGRVYRAEQRVLGRTVAVKIIHPHLLSDENSAVRFITEARAASQLNHPNSVSVIDFGRTDDGQPYLVMEFLRGKDLARVVYEEGPLSFVRIVDILRQVLFALSDAHDMGIVHRDLKPENIICEPLRRGGDHVKVVDFGLAKLKLDTTMPNVTSPGIVCGTPDYMAPEQGRGDPIDGRTDLYSVGIILFQLLTGRLPFESENPTQVVMMHLSVPVPDPTQVSPERDIPRPLVDVVMRALEKEAKHRFQDAFEFSSALEEAIGQVQSEAKPLANAQVTELVVAAVQCPECEALVPLKKFCGECGARLQAEHSGSDPSLLVTLPLPMMGRDEDLAWLTDRRGELSRSVIGARLAGEAGAGKTRLLQEFLQRAESNGDYVAYVASDPFGAEVAYFALKQALTRLLAHRISDGAFLPDLAGVSHEVALAVREIFEGAPTDVKRSVLERRFALAEALRFGLEEAHRHHAAPILLGIDDLHRVDGASRSAFADLLGEPPNIPVLVVATHLQGFETGWSSQAAARVIYGLSAPQVLRILKSIRSEESLRSLAEVGSRGVLPMYVEQVIRFSTEGGKEPPQRLADLLAQRVAALDPDARKLLQAFAVIGDEQELNSLMVLVPTVEDVLAALDQLISAGMLVRHPSGRVSTSHPLLRDIVLAVMPAAVRRDLHARAVVVCEEIGAPIEAHAMHAFYAQDSFQALLLLEQVAERALARGDADAAVLALRRGLDLARLEISRGELDDPLRAVLIFSRKLGDALSRNGDYSDAEGVLREALDLAGPYGSDRARVLSTLAHVAHGRKRSSEAFQFMDEAIEVAKRSGAHDLQRSLELVRRDWAV